MLAERGPPVIMDFGSMVEAKMEIKGRSEALALQVFIIYGRGLLLFKPITSLHFIFTTIEYGTIDDDHCLLKGRTF